MKAHFVTEPSAPADILPALFLVEPSEPTRGKANAWHSYRGHKIPTKGEFTGEGLVQHLEDMGEAWPVYFDPRNERYSTFHAKGLVYLGWYGPGISVANLAADTRFVMEEKRRATLGEWMT